MKIYFDGVIYSWHKKGGIRRYFDELIGRLPPEAEATLILREPHYEMGDLRARVEEMKITGISWPERRFPFIRKIFVPLYALRMNSYFSKISEGVFHSTYFTTYRRLRVPQAVTVHDMTYERFPEFFGSRAARRFIRQKRKCIEKADIVICVSEATKKRLLETCDISEKRLAVVHHGVDPLFNLSHDIAVSEGLRKKHGISRPFFLFVGYRGTYKNFPFLAKAFSRLPESQGMDLILIGGGALSGEEDALLESLGIAGRTKHIAEASETELKTLYQMSRAFIYPSLDEGFGLPILEALRCGTRIIVSDIPVFREVAGDAPLYFDPRDEASLIAALAKSMGERRSAEEAARISEEIGRKYRWEDCVRNTMLAYQKAIANFNAYK